MSLSKQILSDLVVFNKYAKYIPKLGRRETWEELCNRNIDMHTKKYPHMGVEILETYEKVRAKKVLPSMRALEDSTPIITKEGWKTAGEVQTGDILYSSKGLETEVKDIIKFKDKKLYKLTFSDTSELVACGDHLWIIATTDDIKRKKTRVVDTLFIRDHLKQGSKNNITIYNPKPLKREKQNLLVDPYILGHWLGDGYSAGHQISCAVEDSAFIIGEYENLGFSTKQSESSNVWTWYIHGLKKYLQQYNLVDNKHIPREYFIGSIDQRMSLVQGLMDSDGHITPDGRCLFDNTNKFLIEGFKELLSSLGIKYTIIEKVKKKEHHKKAWNISFFTSLPISRLPRKAKNIKKETSSRNLSRKVFSFEEMGLGAATCFHVDSPDHSFLAGINMVVTHNSMQFGGAPVELANNRIYNCAYAACNHPAIFHEAMFLLLGGTGFGYSVQTHHIEQLPAVKGPIKRPRRFLIGDSIEGWADAIKVLMKAYFQGKSDPVFDYRDIREKGAELVTSGGKAPGPDPLRICINQIRGVLNNAIGRKLKSLEIHDIMCHIADAVLSGGIRRAAMIALFSHTDMDMLYCKSGLWYEKDPQRGRSNNSVVLIRGEIEDWEYDKVWEIIERNGTGEPGVFWTNDRDIGTNPCCVSGDTSVMTSIGPSLVRDLVDTQFTAIVNGGEFESTNKGFWYTGDKEVFKVETIEGFELKVTEDHILRTKKGWKELKDIKVGEELCLNNHDSYSWGSQDNSNFEKGWLLGSLVGDGTFEPNTGRAILKYWHDETYLGEYAKDYLSNSFNIPRSKAEIGCANTITIGSIDLATFSEKYGVKQKQKVPNHTLEQESSLFYKGYLRGFFDADGSVQGNQDKGVSIRLSQVSLEALQQVQRMLLRLGIKSVIYQNRQLEGYRNLPDGNGGHAMYLCKASHELVVSKINLVRFSDIVGFNSCTKQDRLDDIISSYKRRPNKETFLARVSSITSVGKERVYDATVPGADCFDANGFIAHNCEISLPDMGFCNLTEVNVSDVESQKELNDRVRKAAFIGTLQAGYTDFHYLRNKWKDNAEKDALIGVGQTGIASGKVLNLSLVEAAQEVVKENRRVANLIGINYAARTTCVKPSGTSSLTVGSSSGIHAWHNDYYIRRMRVGKNEPLYTYMVEKFPMLIEDCVFKPHLEAVMSFPQRAPKGSILRTESYLHLLERVRKFNVEWIRTGHREGANYHNVSCTISLKADEWQECGDWMWENQDYYTGIAVLPYNGDSYEQAPFEDCTEDTYNEMMQFMKDIDLTQVIEGEDNTELSDQAACAGGLCEL